MVYLRRIYSASDFGFEYFLRREAKNEMVQRLQFAEANVKLLNDRNYSNIKYITKHNLSDFISKKKNENIL